MGFLYTAINQMLASQRANYRELKQGDECLAGRYMRTETLNGLALRSEQIKSEIAAEEARAKPDMARLMRLRKIEELLANTLAKCR